MQLAKQNEEQGIAEPLHIDGIDWLLGEEGANDLRSTGLSLEAGKIFLLLGPNGAGKSTLLEKLAGLRPSEGLSVRYGREPLWNKGWSGRLRLNERALGSYSYACQSPEEGLFARSVQEELDYSLRPYGLAEGTKEEARDSALTAVGWDRVWLTRDPYLMSGGERRRSALASVFVTPAPWLLLDEPTAGLDGAGHETVAKHLVSLKANGRGVLLISHDTDWALPLADVVLLLGIDGSIRVCGREELLLHPEWLEETGMKLPEWLTIAKFLLSSGVAINQVWNPTSAALAWNPLVEVVPTEEKERSVVRKEQRERATPGRSHRLAGFDPRTVWLSYVLVSTGLFFLGDWLSLGVGAVVVLALLSAGRVSLRRWRGLIVNYAVFSVVTSFIFAWSAGGAGGVEWGAFAGTLFTFARTMLILLLGLAIPLVMSPLSLRRSLEQMLTIRGRTPLWCQRLILTVTLMMRFVPVLLELWERFVRIFLARGKSMARHPLAISRRLRDVSIPFLLTLFRLGDEVALALESRGVGFNPNPTRAGRLRWRARDYVFVVGALVLAIGLWGLSSRQ